MAGTTGIQNALTVYFTQTAAGAANNDYTLTRPGTVVDCWAIARANQAGGTFQLLNTAAAITDAMNVSVDLVKTSAGTISDTNYAVIAGSILRCQTVGAATLVDACITLVAPVANSTAVV